MPLRDYAFWAKSLGGVEGGGNNFSREQLTLYCLETSVKKVEKKSFWIIVPFLGTSLKKMNLHCFKLACVKTLA